MIGGLYTYGTETAGEFLTNPEPDASDGAGCAAEWKRNQNLQIVLGTTVTDGTPGPPRVLAVCGRIDKPTFRGIPGLS